MTLISLLPETLTVPSVVLLGIGLCLISVVYLAANVIYNLFLHPLVSFPGPIHYRASPLPHLIQEWRGNTVHKWVELHQRYGEVVRISPNQLSYISVNAWRDIYGARAGASSGCSSEMLKEELEFPGDDFEFFAPDKPMISCDATNHARHRRAVGPAFSDRAVRSYEPVLVKSCDDMLNRLQQQQDQENSTTGSGINIMDWFHFVMFDMTSALVFGKSFGNMARKGYHPWVARIFPGMKLIAWSLVITAVPGLGRLVSWFIPKRMVDEARRHMQSIVDMADSRAAEPGPAQSDFMTYIHPHVTKHSSSGSGLSTPELYLNSQLLCIAGSETTASLLAGAVYFLSQRQNKPHLERLLAELQSIFASEQEITPSRLNPTTTPFLCAILSECLRLYPPGAINMPRTVPRGGAFIDGEFVPGGTVVGIAQYAAYRSERHWVDPLTFAPERWLSSYSLKLESTIRATQSGQSQLVTGGGDSACQDLEGDIEGKVKVKVERYQNDKKEIFKPFSHGPRNCVGQNLALAECRLITARLFWRFQVDMLPGQERWVDGQRTFLSWEKPRLMVGLSPRARDSGR